MGLPPNIFFDQSDQQPPQAQDALTAALFNGPSPDQQPQQQQQIQQQPQPSPAQANGGNVPALQPSTVPQGGPVKQGLRGVLLHIMHNVMAGGVPMAAYPGDIMQEAQQKTQAGLANTQAQTANLNANAQLAGAEAANQRSESTARNIQNRIRVLNDPETGQPAFGPDGSIRLGTMDDQKELNQEFQLTGGYVPLSDAMASAIGQPQLAGQKIPRNTFDSLITAQSSKTLESEISRLAQAEIAKGNDPNQSPAIQSLLGIRQALQMGTPQGRDAAYINIYAKQYKGQPLTPDEQAFKAAYEKEKTLTPFAQIGVQNALTKGSSAALANVPPHLVAPATEAATKAGADYAQAQSVSQRLADMMDAARNGNVVSYQLIPQEGALQVTTSQGVHRINMAEIQNYGGGSIFQRLEGHLGGALEGKTIPDSVLNDMAEMQRIQQQGSQAKYNNTLKTINQYYGSNFQPVPIDIGGSANSGSGKFSVSVGGKTYTFKDQQSLDGFKKEAGIQ